MREFSVNSAAIATQRGLWRDDLSGTGVSLTPQIDFRASTAASRVPLWSASTVSAAHHRRLFGRSRDQGRSHECCGDGMKPSYVREYDRGAARVSDDLEFVTLIQH